MRKDKLTDLPEELYENENTEVDDDAKERIFILDENGTSAPVEIPDDLEENTNA